MVGLTAALVLVAAGCGSSTADDTATPTPGPTAAEPAATEPATTEATSIGPTTTGSAADPATTPPTTGAERAPSGEPQSTVDLPSALAGLAGSDEVIALDVEVVATHPHDAGAYTQGLEVVDGLLLESTGELGESSLRLVDPRTGEIERMISLDDQLFGEGATVVGDEVWQLTWQNGTALVHDLDDFSERRRVAYEGEGWGLCAIADRLVMSDGSSRLSFRDQATFDVVGTVEVTLAGAPVAKVNELDCAGGLVWANVYRTTSLVAIDPADGRVVAEADLAELVPPGLEGDDYLVANGVAFDPTTGRFWLTGKRWPVLYEVELVPASP